MPTTGNQPNWDNNNNSISNREGDCTCGEESGDEDPLEQYMKGIEGKLRGAYIYIYIYMCVCVCV